MKQRPPEQVRERKSTLAQEASLVVSLFLKIQDAWSMLSLKR